MPSMLWFLDAAGELDATRIRPGLSDGQTTEVEGPRLEAGIQVIVGISQSGTSTASSNPFQSQQQPSTGPGRPRGSF